VTNLVGVVIIGNFATNMKASQNIAAELAEPVVSNIYAISLEYLACIKQQ